MAGAIGRSEEGEELRLKWKSILGLTAVKMGKLHGKRTPALGGRAQGGGIAEHT